MKIHCKVVTPIIPYENRIIMASTYFTRNNFKINLLIFWLIGFLQVHCRRKMLLQSNVIKVGSSYKQALEINIIRFFSEI